MVELRDAKGEWTKAHDTASATASRDAKAKIAAEKHFGDIEAGELPRSLDRAKALGELQAGMDLQGKFVPDLARAQHVKYVMFKDDNEDGETLPDNTIAIAPVLLLSSEWKDDALSKEQTGWFAPSDPGISPVVKAESHEMGHVVASYLGVKARTDMTLWSAIAKSLGTAMPASEYRPGAADVSKWFNMNSDVIFQHVSQYAATSQEEMLAELWGEYTTSAHPRPAARLYGDYARANLSATRQFSQETV
jgi:hypothetical protein